MHASLKGTQPVPLVAAQREREACEKMAKNNGMAIPMAI